MSRRQSVMRVVIWQWGRYGAGPRFAAAFAEGCEALGGIQPILSLSTTAEIMRSPDAPECQMPVRTYSGLCGLIWQFVRAPITILRLSNGLRRFAPGAAVCAMPGPLDLLMMTALRWLGIPVAVIVHDANAHPGDDFPLLFALQRALLHRADLVVALSDSVAAELRTSGSLDDRARILVAQHPPFDFGPVTPPLARPGSRRLLCFGRLRAYKGLDLLAEALRSLGPLPGMEVRVVGEGPESRALTALRALPGVQVENRWVPENEIASILNWADIVVLPYRQASQSGIAPAAIAAGRRVIATRVGGLPEQLVGEPGATLCEPDAASLAEAIRSSLARPNDFSHRINDCREAWQNFAYRVMHELNVPASLAREAVR